tara:strand:+ start:505 stop:666 length:162 start_codon:yes stop_codon:yes gene_type:complete
LLVKKFANLSLRWNEVSSVFKDVGKSEELDGEDSLLRHIDIKSDAPEEDERTL